MPHRSIPADSEARILRALQHLGSLEKDAAPSPEEVRGIAERFQGRVKRHQEALSFVDRKRGLDAVAGAAMQLFQVIAACDPRVWDWATDNLEGITGIRAPERAQGEDTRDATRRDWLARLDALVQRSVLHARIPDYAKGGGRGRKPFVGREPSPTFGLVRECHALLRRCGLPELHGGRSGVLARFCAATAEAGTGQACPYTRLKRDLAAVLNLRPEAQVSGVEEIYFTHHGCGRLRMDPDGSGQFLDPLSPAIRKTPRNAVSEPPRRISGRTQA